MLYLDLVKFKPINDNLGHDMGDKVLRGIGSRLIVREDDIASRVGGDEFVIIANLKNDDIGRRSKDRISSTPRRKDQRREDKIQGIISNIEQEVIAGSQIRDDVKVGVTIGVSELSGEKSIVQTVIEAETQMRERKIGSADG